jgi:16S rRNA (cytosine1407-C5)-methyltransferase
VHSSVFIPDEFLQLMAKTLPNDHDLDSFIACCQTPLRRSLRVNTLKIDVDAFLKLVAHHNWKLTPIPWCKEGFWIERDDDRVPLGNTAEHLSGLFYIQEASSMLPVTALLQANPNLDCVLDMASAPGSKTTQLAAIMQNKGILVANELSASRIKVLHANLQRCGVNNTALTHFDASVFGEWTPESFNSILLDAPCSGEGAIRKDDQAMTNWSIKSVQDIAAVQKRLIISAFQALKVGGVMVYSTCTLNHFENREVCGYLKDTFGDAVEFESLSNLFKNAEKSTTDDGFLHVFPETYDSEGFFIARIRKLSSVETPSIQKRLGKFPFSKASIKDQSEIIERLNQELQIKISTEQNVWLRDSEVWLFPKNIEPLVGEVRFQRIGVKLAETHKKGYRWQHEAIMSLASGEETIAMALTPEEAQEWFMGKDIRPIENTKIKGDVLVTYLNQPIGLGKWINHRIKNGLPRDLVKDVRLFSI